MKSAVGKTIKPEWCRNWILAKFKNLPAFANGFERNHFFNMAEAAGLWIRGYYPATPQTFCTVLEELIDFESVHDKNGNFCYYAFKLKKGVI
jgi:hypothetical protein